MRGAERNVEGAERKERRWAKRRYIRKNKMEDEQKDMLGNLKKQKKQNKNARTDVTE